MTSDQIVFLAVAGGFTLVVIWCILLSRRVDRVQMRLQALEKKGS
jgi:hypothetical protein